MRVFGTFLALLSATRLATPALCATHRWRSVPAPTEEYRSILDIQFEIDPADIQRAEQEKQRVTAAVADDLVNNLGIARSRVSREGFGNSRRFAYNASAEGQRENRRVNIVLNTALVLAIRHQRGAGYPSA
ncbi:MAG: hypothetical protein ACNA8G_06085 [Gammaproteobacteria bacterium]